MTRFKAMLPAGVAIAAALSMASAVDATVIHVGGATTGAPADGSYVFELTNGSTPFSPVITARYSADYGAHVGTQAVDDSFVFTIPQNGLGSGNFSTSFIVSSNKFTLTDILFNGVSKFSDVTVNAHGFSLATADFLPIVANVENTLRIIGKVKGKNGYSGNLTFAADAVPDAATWLMMVLGFGIAGVTMRSGRRNVAVSFG